MTTTHGEEHPLQHLAIIVRLAIRIEDERFSRVVVLLEIEQDGRRLEHREVVATAIDEDGDAPVGIEFDEPRLFLYVLGYIDLVYARKRREDI